MGMCRYTFSPSSYGISGPDVAAAATRRRRVRRWRLFASSIYPIVLCIYYAMSGTNVGYDATRCDENKEIAGSLGGVCVVLNGMR